MAKAEGQFIFGVGLDGVCADFYRRISEIAAEWLGRPMNELTENVTYGFPEWELQQNQYEDLHRFAVTRHALYETMQLIDGAPQSLHFHETAVAQTVKWLDKHVIPYWDLCFMKDKGAVGADLYIEDTPHNIEALRRDDKPVIIFSNSTNLEVSDDPGGRAKNWQQGEDLVRQQYYQWLDEHNLERPPGPGLRPQWRN